MDKNIVYFIYKHIDPRRSSIMNLYGIIGYGSMKDANTLLRKYDDIHSKIYTIICRDQDEMINLHSLIYQYMEYRGLVADKSSLDRYIMISIHADNRSTISMALQKYRDTCERIVDYMTSIA